MSTVFTEKCHAKNIRKVLHKNTTPQHSGECGFVGGHGSWLLPVFVFGRYGQYILSFCYLQGQIAWGGNFSKLTAEAEIVFASF